MSRSNGAERAQRLNAAFDLLAQGHATAQFNLGLMYSNGQGVPQDYTQAYMWLNLAAANFPASDSRNRRGAIANREVMEGKMTRDQIIEAQKLAREWRPQGR